MAKAGVASRRAGTVAGNETRRVLVNSAIETLKSEGFVGTSARAIAKQAGCNQALVFYHFGSVVDLLLAALDEVSARRLDRYTGAARSITNLSELLSVGSQVFQEDMDNGYVTVLVEMIGGASSAPGLGPEVARRIAPWREFAEHTIESGLADSPLASVLPLGELSHAVVALYLGLEMLSHLDGDRSQVTSLFEHAGRLEALLGTFSGTAPATTKETS
jgi:AcrR family transcriptional regulator